MRQHQILNLARIVVLPFVMSGLLLAGCDAKPPSKKELAALTAADHKAAFEKKLTTFRQKAEAGDAVAQLEMGRAYEQGLAWAVKLPAGAAALEQKDPLVDLKKAADWYEKGAIQGNAEAQFRLGMLWLPSSGYGENDTVVSDGWGGNEVTALPRPRDAAKSAIWLEKAAKQKHAPAASVLARLYEHGTGIKQSKFAAFQNYLIAAEQGHAVAQYNLGSMYSVGAPQDPDGKCTPHYLSDDPNAGNDNYFDQFDTPFCLADKDMGKAAEWWSKAAAQGYVEAQKSLGQLYFNGEGVPKDPVQAAHWLKKAADQGDAWAQNILGVSYLRGDGHPKDASKAFEWFLKSAQQGEQVGQSNLANRYGGGDGVDKDLILAYAWFNLAAANPQGNEYLTNDSKKWRTQLEEFLSPAEVSEAQRISSSWKTGKIISRESPSAGGGIKSTGKLEKTGTGTVFVVSKAGQAITNQHVVNGCAELRIEGRDGVAKLTTEDRVNDLALIRIPGKVTATATIAAKPESLRQGEDIVVFGFPLNAVLSSGGNLTPGVVSALTGLGNNTNQLQITAPIQPGSSGSPVLNKKGEVVGVVNMKLSDSKMARATGEIGQNVNFAISGQTLKAFLDKHKAGYKDGAGFFTWGKDAADLAEEARKWTLVVECWK